MINDWTGQKYVDQYNKEYSKKQKGSLIQLMSEGDDKDKKDKKKGKKEAKKEEKKSTE